MRVAGSAAPLAGGLAGPLTGERESAVGPRACSAVGPPSAGPLGDESWKGRVAIYLGAHIALGSGGCPDSTRKDHPETSSLVFRPFSDGTNLDRRAGKPAFSYSNPTG